MDLHRLRVVEFDTLVSEKEIEKKYNAELEKHEQVDCNISSDDKEDETNETENEKKCLDDSISPQGPSTKNPGDRINPPGISKKCLDDTKRPPATSKCLGDTISPSGTSKTLSFIKRKSKSELKIPPKIKPGKHELKHNSTAVDLTKLFESNAHSHQKKRILNLFNRKSRVDQKVEDVNEKNEEGHFLFARETPSFIRYCRKRAENEGKGKKKKRDYKLPNDVFGFQNNRYIDPYLYEMSCNYLNTDKLPFKKIRKGFHGKPKKPQPDINCICKHHAMRVLKSGENGEYPSIYYNLNTHHHPRRIHRKRDYDQEEALRRERSYYMAKDETVGVSPSSLGPVTKCCCDACTGPSKFGLSAPTHSRGDSPCTGQAYPQHSTPSPSGASAPHAQNKPHVVVSKKKLNKTKKKKIAVINQRKRLFSGFFQKITAFHIKNRPSGKNCIKYACFGLLIVVWSPCLLAVILAWVVMCPVKITNIIKTDTSKRSFPMMNSFMNRFRKKDPGCEYQRMCFENCLPENNRSFMTSVANWYSRAVGTVVNSFNAMISMLKLKNKPTCAGSSFLTSTHPNPRKRYTLFYADNRGWMMKPSRRSNTRSCASTRVVQAMRCEFRPTFWRKSRCNEKCQTKIKSLCKKLSYKCPVHGSRYVPWHPKHQSSPAGDARPMLRNSEVGCICRDYKPSYSGNRMSRNKMQGSAMLMPVASHRLQRPQVNIPPIFFHPTPDIATSSADQTVNTNSINLNSNEIADNMSHKDFVRGHVSQRKNGTLPYGVVLDYPYGTKHPQITNLETFRSHKFGLAGKTLNMSTKYTPSIMLKGLQGQIAKCWIKHEASNTGKKSLGAHRITGCTDIKNSMPPKYTPSHKSHRLRGQTAKSEIALNCPSGRNHKPTITDKKLPTVQENHSIRGKCVLANISQSALSKKAATNTCKINYEHKKENTSKYTPYQKAPCQIIPNKTQSAKPNKASNCPRGAEHEPIKQTYRYKSGKILDPTKKQPRPAVVTASTKPDVALNYLCGAKHPPSDNPCKHKPRKCHVTTQKQPSTADITTCTKRNVALNCFCGGQLQPSECVCKYKSGKILDSTKKQPSPADVTASTKPDIALSCLCEAKNQPSEIPCTYKPRKFHVTTQKQPSTVDITTSTKRDVALNCFCGGKLQPSECACKYKSDKIPVPTQSRSTPAAMTLSIKPDIALNCPCGAKHEPIKQDKSHVTTQKQPSTADITTSTNRDVALNCSCGSELQPSECVCKYKPDKFQPPECACKYKPDKFQPPECACKYKPDKFQPPECACKYKPDKFQPSECACKYKPDKTPVPTQTELCPAAHDIALNCPCGAKHEPIKQGKIPDTTKKQSSPADVTASTKPDIALNCDCGAKTQPSDSPSKHKPDKFHVTTQKHPSTADITTSTKIDVALNCSCGSELQPSECACKYKPDKVPVTTQKQPSTADITTSTKRDVALNCSCGSKLQPSDCVCKYKPDKFPVTTQKESSSADITTSTKRDVAVSCSCGSKLQPSECACKYKPGKPVTTQKQPSTADITTSTKRDIALNCPCGVKPSTVDKGTLYARKQPRTADKDTICTQDSRQDIQKQYTTIDKASECACKSEASITKEMVHPKKPLPPKKTVDCACGSETQPSKTAAERPSKQKPSLCACKSEATETKETVLPKQTMPPKKTVDCACGSETCPCNSEICKAKETYLPKQTMPPKKAVDCACGSETQPSKTATKHPSKQKASLCACKSEATETKDAVLPKQTLPPKKAVDCACGSETQPSKTAAERPSKQKPSLCACKSEETETKETVLPKQTMPPKKTVDCACGSDTQPSKTAAERPSKQKASLCACKSEATETKDTVLPKQTMPPKKTVDCECWSETQPSKTAAERPAKQKPSLCACKSEATETKDAVLPKQTLPPKKTVDCACGSETQPCPCNSELCKPKETYLPKQTVALKKMIDCACGSDKQLRKTTAEHWSKEQASQCNCKSVASKATETPKQTMAPKKTVDCACGSETQPSKTATERPSKQKPSLCACKSEATETKDTVLPKQTMPPKKTVDCACGSETQPSKTKETVLPKQTMAPKKTVDCACGSETKPRKSAAERPSKQQPSLCACKSEATETKETVLPKQTMAPKKTVDCACGSETQPCPCNSEICRPKETYLPKQTMPPKKAVDCACGSEPQPRKTVAERSSKQQASSCACKSEATETIEKVHPKQTIPPKKTVDCACGPETQPSKTAAERPSKQKEPLCTCKSEASKTEETVLPKQTVASKKAADCTCGSDKQPSKTTAEHSTKESAAQCTCKYEASKTKETVRPKQTVAPKKTVDCACGSETQPSKTAAVGPSKQQIPSCACKNASTSYEKTAPTKVVDCSCGPGDCWKFNCPCNLIPKQVEANEKPDLFFTPYSPETSERQSLKYGIAENCPCGAKHQPNTGEQFYIRRTVFTENKTTKQLPSQKPPLAGKLSHCECPAKTLSIKADKETLRKTSHCECPSKTLSNKADKETLRKTNLSGKTFNKSSRYSHPLSRPPPTKQGRPARPPSKKSLTKPYKESLHKTGSSDKPSNRLSKHPLSQQLVRPPLTTGQPQTEELIKQISSRQANGSLFGIASNCPCGLTQKQSIPDKETKQITGDNKIKYTPKPSLAKEPLSQQPKLSQPQSKSLITYTPKPSSAKEPPSEQPKLTQTQPKSLITYIPKPSSAKEPPSQQPNLTQTQSKSLITDTPKLSSAKEPPSQQPKLSQTQPKSLITYTPKPSSAKEPPSQQTKLSQTQSKSFGISSDCTCNTNQPILADNKITYTPKPSSAKEPLSQQSKLTKTQSKSLITYTPKSRTAKETPSQQSKLTQTQSKLFGISADCPCSANQPIVADNKLTYTPKSSSAKEPLSEQPKLTQTQSKSLIAYTPKSRSAKEPLSQQPKLTQKQSKSFGMPSDCTCSTNQPNELDCTCSVNQPITADCICGANQSIVAKSDDPGFIIASDHRITITDSSKTRLGEHLPRQQVKFSQIPYTSHPVRAEKTALTEQQITSKFSQIPSNVSQQQPTTLNPHQTVLVEHPTHLPYRGEKETQSKALAFREPAYENSVTRSSHRRSVDKAISKMKQKETGLQALKKSFGTQISQTSFKYSPFQMSLHHTECTCSVENLQVPIVNKTVKSRIKFLGRTNQRPQTSKTESLGIPHKCLCSRKDIDETHFFKSEESDIPASRNTTRQFSVRSGIRTECTHSVNQPSSQLQTSKISRYSSKVSSLVMKLGSKLFSRKISQQTKKPNNEPVPVYSRSTKNPRLVVISSSQTSKQVEKPYQRLLRHGKGQQSKMSQRSTISSYLRHMSCRCPVDKTGLPDKISPHSCKSVLSDKSNISHSRRSQMSKAPQYPSWPIYSSHSMIHSRCHCQIHKTSSRQSTIKSLYKRKPLLVDKPHSCLSTRSIGRLSKTSQRSSFPSHLSELECSCHVDNSSSLGLSKISRHFHHRLSQRYLGQQFKTSQHSSIVMSEIPMSEGKRSCDETFSTPNDGMSHHFFKTSRKSHPNLPTQLHTISQLSSLFNRSQESSSKLSMNIFQQTPKRLHSHRHLGQQTILTQYPSLDKYQPTPTASQKVLSQHQPSQEPLMSKRSSSFSHPQSKSLAEKLRFITDKISVNSRKNKQEKILLSQNVQTAPIIPGKCACLSEKVHQISEKISLHSRKPVVDKIPQSEPPPRLLSSQPTQPGEKSHKTTFGTKAKTGYPQHLPIQKSKVSKRSRHYSSETTPLTDTEGLTSDPVKPLPHINTIADERPPKFQQNVPKQPTGISKKSLSSTDNQKLTSDPVTPITRRTTEGTDRPPGFQQSVPSQPSEISKQSRRDSSHPTSSTEPQERTSDPASPLPLKTTIGTSYPPDASYPIIPGICRCKQQRKTEYLDKTALSNKLKLNTDTQNIPSRQPEHAPRLQSLPNDSQRFPETRGEFPPSQHSASPNSKHPTKLNSQSTQLGEKSRKTSVGTKAQANPQHLPTQKPKVSKQSSHFSSEITPLTDTEGLTSDPVKPLPHRTTIAAERMPEYQQNVPSQPSDISKQSRRDSSHPTSTSEPQELTSDPASSVPLKTTIGTAYPPDASYPIIPGMCRCKQLKTEYLDKTVSSNKLKLNTDSQNLPSRQPEHAPRLHSLPTDSQRSPETHGELPHQYSSQHSAAANSKLPDNISSQPTQPGEKSRKTTLGTKAQTGYPQHLPIQKPKVSKQSRHYSSETTPLTDTEGLTSDPVKPLPHINTIADERPPKFQQNVPKQPTGISKKSLSSTDNQKLTSDPVTPITRRTTEGTDRPPGFQQSVPSQPSEISKQSRRDSSHPTSSTEPQERTSDPASPLPLKTTIGTSYPPDASYPIIPGICRCKQQRKTEYLDKTALSNKLKLNTDTQNIPSRQPEHAPRLQSLPNDSQRFPETRGEFPPSQHSASPNSKHPTKLNSQSTQLGEKSRKTSVGTKAQANPQHLPTQKPKVSKQSSHFSSEITPLTDTEGLTSDPVKPLPHRTTIAAERMPEYQQNVPSQPSDISKQSRRDSSHPTSTSEPQELTSDPASSVPLKTTIGTAYPPDASYPIIPGMCRCKQLKTEYLDKTVSSNKLKLNTDSQNLPSRQPEHAPRLHSLPTDSQRSPETHGELPHQYSSQHSAAANSKLPDNISSQPTQPGEKSRKTTLGTKAQTGYPQHLPIQKPKVSKQSRHYSSETTPLTDSQGLTSDPVTPLPHRTTVAAERPREFQQNVPRQPSDISKQSRRDSSHPTSSSEPQELTSDPSLPLPLKTTIGTSYPPDASYPIIPGVCRCKQQQLKTEYLDKTALNNKLKLSTDSQNLPSRQPEHAPRLHSLPTDSQRYPDTHGELPQHSLSKHSATPSSKHPANLSSQPIPSVEKQRLLSRHLSSQPTPLPKKQQLSSKSHVGTEEQSRYLTPLHNSPPTRIIPGKCSCIKHENLQEVEPNPLKKNAETLSPEMSHHLTSENFQKSHLISGICTGGAKKKRFARVNVPNNSNHIGFAEKLLGRQYMIIQHSEVSQSSQNPQIQPNQQNPENPEILQYSQYQQNPKNAVYPPNLAALKRNSCEYPTEQPQIPPDKIWHVLYKTAPVDKPPPGLLQRHASGQGRISPADGGVQRKQQKQQLPHPALRVQRQQQKQQLPYPAFRVQRQKLQLPYPDFNRVSMRYPGHNSPPSKQLGRVQPPANYYTPVCGATPRRNYARFPCYINPANKCGPKSCFDEFALRRAYKRRPLRYTPPRQQVPKPDTAKKKKKKKRKAAAALKKKKPPKPPCKLSQCCKCVRDLVTKAEKEAWPTDVTCHPMWIHALKHKPCFWIYEWWPSIYPAFLSCYKFQQNLSQMLMYVFAICFWCPLIFCGYLCCDIICKGC